MSTSWPALDSELSGLRCLITERDKKLESVARVLNSPELMETLADIEHERWSGWEKYRESVSNEEKEAHWKKLRETPYSDLEEWSKESDRDEVRKTLTAIKSAIHRG